MSSEFSIRVNGLSKNFPVYSKPHHRLFQMFSPTSAKSRWFREFRALTGVDFEIHRGETVAIVGRNGSGKSTLLQIICGTLAPSTGSVEVNGRIAALLELGAGFNPEFTGRENVYLNGTVLGLTRAEIDARFDEIVAFADIGEFIEQPVRSYSSGMYVRLAFAVAIHVMPDILVVDEALSVGDEAFQRKCFARIEKIRDAGATVLFVSHAPSTVLELCNRAILLDRGELLAVGTPKRVISRYQKMLYAPSNMVASIRARMQQEMAASRHDGGMEGVAGKPELAHVLEVENSQQLEQIEDTAEDSYFDPGLISQSMLRFETHGAVIEDPHIQTPAGLRVNVLKPGGEFFYTYTVRFDRAAVAVTFGMLIKTISGVELGGATSATPVDAIDVVESGAAVHVKFKFRCLLAPGTYFLNAGVRGRVDNEETFLDRIIDAALFRVPPDSGRLATGFVDFHVRPDVEMVDNEPELSHEFK
ncbi:lipopolysaccharide transport system ATP-binding protein [Dyella sp. OK004]|uniref:ABC transporter ATP-binding protein n=1 Tax=Dyella sp. OK004 TaxID=1855292 RepID=UPI0008EB9996|nr:ABC transporter ATP-binding protein [Dyella sp. OK004]SFS07912.1 lipopolysaccharide transport system ATP-binding protein [Dyella sp. OK004]